MKEICWLSRHSPLYHDVITLDKKVGVRLDHWSRKFEYPWLMDKGGFEPNQMTLDAGGGDSPLQWVVSYKTGCLINLDIDAEGLERGQKQWNRQNIVRYLGSIEKNGFMDGFFDRVICCSVLEHITNHEEILRELWRVLRPKGRLLLTFDVADYARWNHTIDLEIAARIAGMYGLTLPDLKGASTIAFKEENVQEGEPDKVWLKVLCIGVTKKE